MKFLAIDTSAKYLSVIACNGGAAERIFLPDCAMKHSIVLMDKIGEALAAAHMTASACDFFAVVTGPGSFTGIRIGISTVKGLCFACDRPALSVTSFDCFAYDDKSKKKVLALSDAGRGELYACGYEEGKIVLPPTILPREEAVALSAQFTPVSAEELFPGCKIVDPCNGFLNAVVALSGNTVPCEQLHAVYLRKSSAEENRR